MKSRLQNMDNGDEFILPELHSLQFNDLRERVAANDFNFFECVAAMLKHLKQNKGSIAEMEWRSVKKFADGTPQKPEQVMTLNSAMEFAVFKVLSLRAPLPLLNGGSAKFVCDAVTRKELRMALRHVQTMEGSKTPCQVSQSHLSVLIHTTSSGKFLAPFMEEQPIVYRKQKLQSTHNRVK